MKTYTVTIRLITDYLQARFTENAKKELENYVSRGIIKSTDDSWKVFLHEDENGIYIPAIQIRNCLVNSGRDFKYKKTRRSLQQWAISNLMVEPDKIYLGKKTPDSILISYPARKDGNRVTIKHPAISKGIEVQFSLKSIDDDMEDKAINGLIQNAGKMYGLGARRRDMYGRFELVTVTGAG